MTQPSGMAGYARLLLAPPGYVQGWQEKVTVPQPAAGAEWSYTVDGRWHERLIAATFTFTADAVVATRTPRLSVYDAAGTELAQVPAAGGVLAGTSATAWLVGGAPAFSAGASGSTPGFLPDLLLPPGWSWRTHTLAIDAGDQYSGISLIMQRFPSDITRVDVAG